MLDFTVTFDAVAGDVGNTILLYNITICDRAEQKFPFKLHAKNLPKHDFQ